MTQPPVSPDDIPTSVTQLSETAPNVAMTDPKRAAWALAHFWPAIEQHIREQVAREIEAIEPLEWAIASVHAGHDAARIARGEQQ